MTPDVNAGSEDEADAPEEPVDGRLQLPEPKALDRGEAGFTQLNSAFAIIKSLCFGKLPGVHKNF